MQGPTALSAGSTRLTGRPSAEAAAHAVCDFIPLSSFCPQPSTHRHTDTRTRAHNQPPINLHCCLCSTYPLPAWHDLLLRCKVDSAAAIIERSVDFYKTKIGQRNLEDQQQHAELLQINSLRSLLDRTLKVPHAVTAGQYISDAVAAFVRQGDGLTQISGGVCEVTVRAPSAENHHYENAQIFQKWATTNYPRVYKLLVEVAELHDTAAQLAVGNISRRKSSNPATYTRDENIILLVTMPVMSSTSGPPPNSREKASLEGQPPHFDSIDMKSLFFAVCNIGLVNCLPTQVWAGDELDPASIRPGFVPTLEGLVQAHPSLILPPEQLLQSMHNVLATPVLVRAAAPTSFATTKTITMLRHHHHHHHHQTTTTTIHRRRLALLWSWMATCIMRRLQP